MFKQYWRIIILLMLLALGFGVGLLNTDHAHLMAWGNVLADRPWTIVVIILIQAGLFATALPGSMALLLVAPFYDPLHGTLILTAGTISGGLAAYVLASRLGDAARARLADRKGFKILSRRSDVFTQCALRLIPGFPHAIVNYGAGVLRLPIGKFLAATSIAALIKWSVYTTAIHGLAEAEDVNEALNFSTLFPLVLLTLLLVLSSWIMTRFQNGSTQYSDQPE